MILYYDGYYPGRQGDYYFDNIPYPYGQYDGYGDYCIVLREVLELTIDYEILINDDDVYSEKKFLYPVVFASGQVIPSTGWKIVTMFNKQRNRIHEVRYFMDSDCYKLNLFLVGKWRLNAWYAEPNSNLDVVVVSLYRKLVLADVDGYIYQSLYHDGCVLPCDVNDECTVKGAYVMGGVVNFDNYTTLTFDELNTSAKISIPQGTVIINGGNQFDGDGNFLVSGWEYDFSNIALWSITWRGSVLTIVYNGVENVKTLYIDDITFNIKQKPSMITLYNAGLEMVRGNPFAWKFKYGGKTYYLNSIDSWNIEHVDGAHYVYNGSENVVKYTQIIGGTEHTITITNKFGDKININEMDGLLYQCECESITTDKVVVREPTFRVTHNRTLSNVEFVPHIFVRREYTFVFRDIVIDPGCTLSVPYGTVVVTGNLDVPKSSVLNCKRLVLR